MSLTHQQLLFQGNTFFKIRTRLITPCNVLAKVKVNQSHYRPEVSRKLRFPDFMTTAQDGGRLSALGTSRFLPQETFLVLISIRGCVDPRTIVRSEGLYQ